MRYFNITSKGISRLRRASPYIVAFTIVAGLIVYANLRGESDDNDLIGGPAPPSPTSMTNTSAEDLPASTSSAQVVPKTRKKTSAKPSGSKVIAWIEDYGPMGGASGARDDLFASLSMGLCQDALDDVTGRARPLLTKTQFAIYRGAASACLAAFDNRPELWTDATRAAARVAGRATSTDCVDSAVHRVLRTLIDAHRDAPTARLVQGSGGSASRPDCPRITSLKPDHGSASGGYQIRITGEHLPNPAVIHFDERTTTVATDGTRAIITVPPADSEYSLVGVWVGGWPYDAAGSPVFAYDQKSTTTSESVPRSRGGR